MEKIPALSEEDYLQIEDALCTNARGRAFLRMRDRRAGVVATDEVKDLMRQLAGGLNKAAAVDLPGSSTHIRILRQELQEMSGYIQQTRNEIAALRPDNNGNNRIMAATGELDAIVSATERATSDILNSAENIQALVATLPQTPEARAAGARIEAEITEIMTACSFQDITGQRTTKVVNTLHYLEKRVNSMIGIWGTEDTLSEEERDNDDGRPDAHLLNGPTEEGVSQADVDALLAELNAIEPTEKPAAQRIEIPRAAAVAVKPPHVKSAPAKPAPVKIGAANGSGAVIPATDINQNDIDALFD